MKWDFFAWQRASDLMEQAERIHRNLLQIIAVPQYLAPSGSVATWVPPVNVVETDQAWWVISALPGVEPDQIEVRLDGDELIIAGTRPPPPCGCQGELRIWEIPVGRFERRLNLTPGIQFTITETRFEGGLLITQLKKSL